MPWVQEEHYTEAETVPHHLHYLVTYTNTHSRKAGRQRTKRTTKPLIHQPEPQDHITRVYSSLVPSST